MAPYHIAPMPNGGLQIEWRRQLRSIELWIDPEGTFSALVDDGAGDVREKLYLNAAAAAADIGTTGA